jgi:phosphoribosyl 1,2-cyclic phosphodiesterase
MKLKFWGVRGSIACPGPDTVHFGGNTACIELRFEDLDRRIIIDAGSGIRLLGHDIIKRNRNRKPFKADIFITHTHWDHIMGFPFFDPIYHEGTELNIYGPVTYEEDPLEQIVGDQLRYRYFPVLHSDLAAKLHYFQIGETQIDLGDGIVVKSKFLNHTLLCLGYRIEYGGRSVCTAFDTDPFRNLFAGNKESPDFDQDLFEEGERVTFEENQRNVNFFRDSDVLIHDAQYTESEYTSMKQGWGHSHFEHAIQSAAAAGVGRLFFFHHDPHRTDDELHHLSSLFQEAFRNKNGPVLIMAREGEEIDI